MAGRWAIRAAICFGLVLACSGLHATLEDIYGLTGERFQGSISFINFQAITDDTDPAARSFGLAIDDMEVEWEEFLLVGDATECSASGSCAVVSLDRTNVFTGVTILGVNVVDHFPYGEDGVNDCDGNGSFVDAVDDADCDNDGTGDMIVNLSSEVEPSGEDLVCNSTGVPGHFPCEITTSTTADSDGVLFLAPGAHGESIATARYRDLWDGRSFNVCVNPSDPDNNAGFVCTDDAQCTNATCELSLCLNDVDPYRWGLIEATTQLFFPSCEVIVSDVSASDNGDDDQFGDTNESLEIELSFMNACGSDLTNCIARMASNSPEVDCITDGFISVGDLPDGATVASSSLGDGFAFKVAEIHRTNVFTDLTADFTVTLACDQIDATVVRQQFSITLDLDQLSGPSIPWAEGFESADPQSPGDFAGFVADNLDAGIPPGPGETALDALARADGMRCQYSDPDNPDSGPFGSNNRYTCYPGYNPANASEHWWEISGTGDTCDADSGRAYEGTQSLYFGKCLDATLGYTTPSAQLEGVKSDQPINLGVGSPVLSFKHQVSLRALSETPDVSSERAIVSAQIAGDFCSGGSNDGGGCDPVLGADCPGGICVENVGVGPWVKLNPFLNSYATTNYDFYNACMFDPADDGNTEDDFFDPENPLDALGLPKGPSSTCSPELTWSWMGDTDGPFDAANVGHGLPGSGLQGSLNHAQSGTWVETSIDLSEFRGRRVRLRFLTTSMKATTETWEGQYFPYNPWPADDGWWIDDLRIDDTLAEPAFLVIDTKPNQVVSQGGTFAECGNACNDVTALAMTTPSPALLRAPGQALEIDASDSFADRCHSGILQYRFSTAGGQELRDWTDNPVILVAPIFSTDYVVEARCSTVPGCSGSTVVAATVNCPTSVATPTAFGETILADANKNRFSWVTSQPHAVFTGDIGLVNTYTGSIVAHGDGSSFTDSATPATAGGFYYLVRKGQYCNDAGLWTSGGPGETPLRETALP